MKRISRIVFSALLGAALLSCLKESETGDILSEGGTLQTFTATIEATRTSLSGGSTLWSEGDRIKLVFSDGSASDATLTGGADTKTGQFTGSVPAGKTALYAVYPSKAYSSVSGSTVKAAIPASQDGSFSAGNIAVAKVDGSNMAFRNINSFLVFQLKSGTDVTRVEVSSVDGSALAGTVPINCSGAAPSAGNPSGPSSSVSMVTNGGGIYYMSVVAGPTHSKGLKMSYFVGDTETGVYYLDKNFTVAASQLYTLGEVETGRNYYVTVSGSGKKSGMDWANAMSAEQMWRKLHLSGDADSDAAAISAIDGATFRLAAGDYDFGSTPLISFNEDEPVTLTIKGGYKASTGTENWENYATSITGNDSHACLQLSGKMNITLEGLRFVHGKVSGTPAAALSCSGSSLKLTMVDCLVADNVNPGSGGSNAGAGLLLSQTGTFEARRVRFSGNTSNHAPALICKGTNMNLTSCVFESNHATSWGGAVRIRYGKPSCVFKDCSFSGNSAYGDAGCVVHNDGTTTFDGCTFTENTSSGNGGAITMNGSGSVILKGGSSFSDNVAGHGGAIYTGGSGELSITGCSFTGNHTIGVVGESGDKRKNGGALMVTGTSLVKVRGSSFDGNYGSTGGAVQVTKSSDSYPSLFMNACSFSGNYVLYGYGTAINVDYASYFCINNSSFKNNTYTANSSNISDMKACWIGVDGIRNKAVISNCSLLGATKKASGDALANAASSNALIGLYCGNTLLVNDMVILNSGGSMFSVRGSGESTPLDAYYTHYSKNENVALSGASTGNTSGYWKEHTRYGSGSDEADWEDGCWKWNGYYVHNGATEGSFDKISLASFTAYLNTACPDFVSWLGGDIDKDQLGNNRGSGSWLPGAYQEKAGTLEVILQVITWNIRSSDMDDTGDHAWSARRGGMAAFINDRQPHIICMQECESDQRSYLTSNCSGYSAIYDNTSLSWWQQLTGAQKSAEVILYKSSKVTVQSSGTFWLVSGAPTSPTKSSDQNAYRSCTWMKCTYQGQKMLVMDVHLSYRTKNNSTPGSDDVIALRRVEMSVIKKWIDSHYNAASDGWLLFMGDMNCSHWEAIFDEWKDGTYGYFSRDKCPGGSTGRTFNNWDWENGHVATIDFQFYKGFPSVKSYTIPTETYSDVDYLSDHWPVVVEYRMQ